MRHTEGPDEQSQDRPSPARDTPHMDELDSLEPKPSWTHEPDSYMYGHLNTTRYLVVVTVVVYLVIVGGCDGG
jgi:hypothetical protein